MCERQETETVWILIFLFICFFFQIQFEQYNKFMVVLNIHIVYVVCGKIANCIEMLNTMARWSSFKRFGWRQFRRESIKRTSIKTDTINNSMTMIFHFRINVIIFVCSTLGASLVKIECIYLSPLNNCIPFSFDFYNWNVLFCGCKFDVLIVILIVMLMVVTFAIVMEMKKKVDHWKMCNSICLELKNWCRKKKYHLDGKTIEFSFFSKTHKIIQLKKINDFNEL